MRIRKLGAIPKPGPFPKKVQEPKVKVSKAPTPGFSNVMDQAKQTAGLKSKLKSIGHGAYEVEKISMTLREFTKLAINKFAAGPVAGYAPSLIERLARISSKRASWKKALLDRSKNLPSLSQKAAVQRLDSPEALKAYSKLPLADHLKSSPRLFGGMRIHGRQWK